MARMPDVDDIMKEFSQQITYIKIKYYLLGVMLGGIGGALVGFTVGLFV